MTLLPTDVRAVFFDAVGTLIHPEPAAAAAYALIGQRFGTRLPPLEIASRFGAAFRRQEEEDARRGHRTDEERELLRWRAIVAEVLDDVADLEGCYQALYDHFARPSAWRCDPAAAEVIEALSGRGLIIGMASNFDRRLRGLVEGLTQLVDLGPLVISSEVGWKKPAPEFFAALCRKAGLAADQVLLVGDDEVNDHRGALAAGLRSVLFKPGEGGEGRITDLRDLLK